MSEYVREKVLRIPLDKIDLNRFHPRDNDLGYLDIDYPDIFGYLEEKKFTLSPTRTKYIDYTIEYDYDSYGCGEFYKSRKLNDREKIRAKEIFDKIDPNINVDDIRLVEFCWYGCCEAEDCYDEMTDSFYKNFMD